MPVLACASDQPDDSNHQKVEAPQPSPANSTSTVEHGDNNNPFMALVDAAASLLQVNNKNSKAQQPAVAVVDEDDDASNAATKTRDQDDVEDAERVIEGSDSSSQETLTAAEEHLKLGAGAGGEDLEEEVQPSSSALGGGAAATAVPECASRTAPSPSSPPPATTSPTPSSSTTSAPRRTTFPEELMDVLDDEAHHDVLAWMPNGISFTIVNHKKFVMTKMPELFKIRNMSSFVRKLSRWGFQRVHDPTTNNSDIFRHPHFQQGQRSLLSQVKCVAGLSGSHSSPSVPSLMMTATATKVTLPNQQGPALGRPSPVHTPPPSLHGRRTLTPPPHLAQQRPIRVTTSAAPVQHRKVSSSSSKSSGSTNKNLVSQSSALKKALKNRGHLLMTPHVNKNKNSGSGTTVYFTSAATAAAAKAASSSAPVTPCSPPNGNGSAGIDPSHPMRGEPSTYYTFVAPSTATGAAHDGGAGGRMMPDPRYLHQPRLSPPSNPMMYSAYGMEPSMMMMPMSMHQHQHPSHGGHQQHHHHHQQQQPQHDVAPSVHERLLSVAEDPRLPASLRRRLVSVALDSLRDELDDASGRSVVTCPLSTSTRSVTSSSSSSYHNSLDTSLGRSMSSLSSSTRSSATTTSTSSPTSGMYHPMRPTLSQTRAAMLYPSMPQQQTQQQAPPPPYLPMSVSGVAATTTGPPTPHYRHMMRRADVAGGPGSGPSVGSGGGGYGGAVPYR